MATWKHVREIAMGLPDTTERPAYGTVAWFVHDKLFVWERPLRPSDLKALGTSAPTGAILGVRVAHQLAKEACLSARADVCFTTPHFDGYPAVLVRLGKIGVKDLREMIVKAWLARAPKKLVRDYFKQD